MYSEFYDHLETEVHEKWSWDRETQNKAQGLFAECRRFHGLVAFAVLFNGLEPLNLLATKLRKRKQDIYQAYHMIDQVLSDLKDVKNNIVEEFSAWFKFTVDMVASVVTHQDNQGQKNAEIILKIMFRALIMKVTTVDHCCSCDGQSHQQLRG